MQKILAFGIVLSIALATSVSAAAAKKKAEEKPAQDASSEICAAAVSERKILSVPKFRDLFAFLQDGGEPKGEFETTEAYKSRIERKRVAANSWLTRELGFSYLSINIPIIEELRPVYDADKGILNFSFKYGYGNSRAIGYNYEHHSVNIDSFKVPTGTYEASNAYGKTVTVSQARSEELSVVVISKPRDWTKSRSWPSSDAPFSVKMPPEEARLLKERASIILVSSLRSPLWIQHQHTTKPKIDYPYEITINTSAIFADPVCVSLYDPVTGKVLKALPKL